MGDEIASLQVTKEEYVQHGSILLGQRIVEDLQSAGKKPYFIPVGGSNALGTWGYLNFFEELIDQSSEAPFTDIVMVRGLQIAAYKFSLSAKSCIFSHLTASTIETE